MFTTDEVDAAVSQYLSGALTVGYTASGSRTTTELRDGALELLATTLMLRPDAWFYLIGLCCNRLIGEINEQLSSFDTIVEAAQNTSGASKDVSSVAELAAARSALLDVSSGLSSRTTGINGSIGPGVERFRRSISRFVSTELGGVVSGSDVVPTAQESRNTIRTEWALAASRHETLVELASAISSAVTALGAARLPQRAAQGVVQRVSARVDALQSTLGQSGSSAENRTAFLDLLAARALLTRISGFTTPRLTLMPLSTDPSTGTVQGTGDEVETLGTVSGPYNYAGGATVELSLNSAATTPVVVLPQDYGSCAVLYTAALTFPGPSAPSTVAIRSTVYDTFHVLGLGGSWADGVAAAAALNTAFSTWFDVYWEPLSSRLVFVSKDSTDASLVEFDQSTAQRVVFTDWAFGSGGTVRASAAPVPASAVVNSFAASDPGVHAAVDIVSYGSYSGSRYGLLPTSVSTVKLTDTGLTCDGAGRLTGLQNYEDLGVVPGDGAAVYAPISQSFAITAVSAGVITVDDPTGVIPAGPVSAVIGPDHRGLDTGLRVKLVGSTISNTGYYRVDTGHVGYIELDREIAGPDTSVQVIIWSETLRLSAVGASTTSGLGVSASAGATALGLSASAEVPASLQQFSIVSGDFLLRGVAAGDQLTLVAPSTTTYVVEITAVATRQVTFEPAVPYAAGAWTYSVQNRRMVDYAVPQDAADAFLTSYSEVTELSRVMDRLALGGRYSAEYETALQAYVTALGTLRDALDAYDPNREPSVDHVVETFGEQGLDRALDLLLALDISELFSMHPDGVSYASWVTRRAADAAREVAPQSKFTSGSGLARGTFSSATVYDPLGRGRR